MRKKLAQPLSALAVLLETKGRACKGQTRLTHRHTGQALATTHSIRQLLAVKFVEKGLLVEEVELRGSTALKEIDHTLGARREMQAGQNAAR